MGYNLHITRKEDWFDGSKNEDISPEEWVEYVKGDPELQVDGFMNVKATDIDGTMKNEKRDIFVWTTYSKLKENGGWIYYDHGNITVKNPDNEFIHKMKLIAQSLQAKVVGDDGELYS